MNAERNRQLLDIVALSRKMLDAASGEDWVLVAELEDRRRQLVALAFRDPVAGDEAGQTARAIREILALNQQVEELGRDCRDRLGSSIRAGNVGRAARAAYRSCAR